MSDSAAGAPLRVRRLSNAQTVEVVGRGRADSGEATATPMACETPIRSMSDQLGWRAPFLSPIGLSPGNRSSSKKKSVFFHDLNRVLEGLREERSASEMGTPTERPAPAAPQLGPSPRRSLRSLDFSIGSSGGTSASSQWTIPKVVTGANAANAGAERAAPKLEAVRVALRIRPMLPRDRTTKQRDVLRLSRDGTCVSFSAVGETERQSSRRGGVLKGASRVYSYDVVLDSREDGGAPATQALVHESVGETVIQHAQAGYNTCLFAYGQTGSGKTHTICGHAKTREERGLLPRILEGIYAEADKLATEGKQTASVKISFMEIYNETISAATTRPSKTRSGASSFVQSLDRLNDLGFMGVGSRCKELLV